eukprot:GHVU01110189.1.p1 GENE.GHVU01110189.1~~GHVU01110189.1.p1  ORF type:complete len:127 (-),score=3.64 GHVU01110189.1:450-830(-)
MQVDRCIAELEAVVGRQNAAAVANDDVYSRKDTDRQTAPVMRVCVEVWAIVCLCACMHGCVCKSVCVRACMGVSVCTCMRACMGVCPLAYVCTGPRIYMCPLQIVFVKAVGSTSMSTCVCLVHDGG